jgi:hypothetical protein
MKFESWFKSKQKGEVASSYHLFKQQVGEVSITCMANVDNIYVGKKYRVTHMKKYFMA